MKGMITKVEQKPSYRGGFFWYVFFKLENGHTAKTCIYQNYNNSKRWMPIIQKAESFLKSGQELWLDGLMLRGNLVDADSQFRLSA